MLQASCNSVDEAGSSPLHLAAWAGHGELVRVLLETGPSVPNVNLTNGDKETSLHCAAQVTNGNTAVGHVTALLTSDWLLSTGTWRRCSCCWRPGRTPTSRTAARRR